MAIKILVRAIIPTNDCKLRITPTLSVAAPLIGALRAKLRITNTTKKVVLAANSIPLSCVSFGECVCAKAVLYGKSYRSGFFLL